MEIDLVSCLQLSLRNASCLFLSQVSQGSYDSKVLSPQCNFQRQTLSSRYCVSGTGMD